ncbi:MAG: PEP-CTERM sorting domain-containing protein [Planctomycetota bacterium]
MRCCGRWRVAAVLAACNASLPMAAQTWDVRVAFDGSGPSFDTPIDAMVLPDGTRALGFRDATGRPTVAYDTPDGSAGFSSFSADTPVAGALDFVSDAFGIVHFATPTNGLGYGMDFGRRENLALDFEFSSGAPVSSADVAIAVDARGVPTIAYQTEPGFPRYTLDTFDPVDARWGSRWVPMSSDSSLSVFSVDAAYLADGRLALLSQNLSGLEIQIEDASLGWAAPFVLTADLPAFSFAQAGLTAYGSEGWAFSTFDSGGVEVGVYDGAFLTRERLPLPSNAYRLLDGGIASDGEGGLGVVFTDFDSNTFYAERFGPDDWRVENLGVSGEFAALAYDADGSPVIGVLEDDSDAVLLVTRGIVGDYNGSGQVEQGDLNLVLNNWGLDTSPEAAGVPAGWVNDRPSGVIDQAELNGVLNNWGATGPPSLPGAAGNAVVPEPAGAIGLGGAVGLLIRRRRQLRSAIA